MAVRNGVVSYPDPFLEQIVITCEKRDHYPFEERVWV